LLALIIVLGCSVANAEVHRHAEGKISIEIPDSWKVVKDKAGLLFGVSKDNTVGLVLWVVEPTRMGKSILELDKLLASQVTDVKWEAPDTVDLNGFTGSQTVGTAKVGGKPALVQRAIIGLTPSNKSVILFVAVEQGTFARNEKMLGNILASLKPLKR
jgi:hypothetical protein